MDIQKSFGLTIRKLRIESGMSQEKFALHIGMDRTYYASVEAGKRNIAILNIQKIAEGFDISLSDLFKLAETTNINFDTSKEGNAIHD